MAEGMKRDLKLRIRRLKENEPVTAFDCRDESLNDFIANDAGLYGQALLAASYVAEDIDTDKVLAYFSLANDRISLGDFETGTEFNRFRRRRFPNDKRMKSYPAGKLCRLAVDLSARNMRLGTYLVDYIKSMFVSYNNMSGCRFLTVDAYSAAMPFYVKNGFVPLSSEDTEASARLMYFDLMDISAPE